MRVICDSGPLTHLWQIGQWPTFGTFDAIYVAAQVAAEVKHHVQLAKMQALAGRDVTVDEVSRAEVVAVRQVLPPDLLLQEADVATLALARRQPPDLVLTDDLTMRQAVEAQGQTPMGSVGILLRALKAGILDANALDQALERLFVHSTLYLSPSFKSYVRRLIVTQTTR